MKRDAHGTDHVVRFTRPSGSVFAYCKRSKTGVGERLGTRLWATSIARKVFFLDLEKPGLPKILLSRENVRESQLADNTNEQQLSYIPRHVPNTCGFCDVMVEYSLLLGRYSLRL